MGPIQSYIGIGSDIVVIYLSDIGQTGQFLYQFRLQSAASLSHHDIFSLETTNFKVANCYVCKASLQVKYNMSNFSKTAFKFCTFVYFFSF